MSDESKNALGSAASGATSGLDGVLRPASRYSVALPLFLIVCGVAVVAIGVTHDLRNANAELQNMYAESVQGLRRIGEMQYQVQETRRMTLYALTTNNSNLQVEYADQSRQADRLVAEGINEYLRQARRAEEVEVGRRLQRDWSDYISVRNQVLASILEGDTKDAVNHDIEAGVQSFNRVSEDLEETKRLYDAQAAHRIGSMTVIARRSMIRLAVVLILVALLVIASVWVIQRSYMLSALQRNKMLNAMELTRLQMEFVASVSHELRSPLAVISSAADNIVDGVVSAEQELKRYGKVIRFKSRQITDLVNQILLFASTKDRQKRYVLLPFEVSKLIDSAVDNTAELVQESGFVIERHIAEDLPSVMGDQSELSQCLQNLIANAMKYSGDSRWVGIRATCGARADGNDQEVRITISDRGIGIDRTELPHIFEPFYRSPKVSAVQIHGTGLGLTLAKSIAESMGGRLSVVSELGAGSSFTLHLTVAEGKRVESETIATQLGAMRTE
jgi:signal transduction histidine kinase